MKDTCPQVNLVGIETPKPNWAGIVLMLVAGLASSFVPPADASSPDEALQAGVRANDPARVKAALDAGAAVDARDPMGGTALLAATWTGNPALVSLLLAHGADVNMRHRETAATPLYYAVITSKPEIARLLLDAGADVLVRYKNEQTALHLAAARTSVSIIEMLLSSHAPLAAVNVDGNSPLNESVLHNQPAALHCLLQHGANVNQVRAVDGRTLMHQACMKGYRGLIPILLQAGADREAKDRFGQTPLDLALAYKNSPVIPELLKASTGSATPDSGAEQAMEAATLRGQTEIVRLLVQNGFDVNRETTAGSTYLHDAALKNQVKIAELLIQAGAKLEARNRAGRTPLHDAAIGGSLEMLTLLLDKGADINARDGESDGTALMLAASLSRVAAVELLLRRGADPKLKDRLGRSALDRAQQNEDGPLIRLLRNPPQKY